MQRNAKLWTALVLGWLATGCGVGDAGKLPPRSTAHQVHPVAAPTKLPGESCAIEGASVCRPDARGGRGICFHYGKGLDAKGNDPAYVCTTACSTSRDCAQDFTCEQLLPGKGNRVCAPPPDFVPKIAGPRTHPYVPQPPSAASAGKLVH